MSKFICEFCDKEYDIKDYSIGFDENKIMYFKRRSKIQLICDCRDKAVLKPIENEKSDFSNISFNHFSAMSVKDKQKMLKKRSHEHYEKEIKEKKHEMGKETIKHLLKK